MKPSALTENPSGTPDWAYDEDGYCVCCGYGRWRYHGVECELADALDRVEATQVGGAAIARVASRSLLTD